MSRLDKIVQATGHLAVTLKPFIGLSQRKALYELLKGEEADHFAELLIGIADRIEKMPKTYEQDGAGDDAIVSLHYFRGAVDAWVTEKDKDGGVSQAFGFVNLGFGAEMGYLSITELVDAGCELDLYTAPMTVGQLKLKGRI